MNLESGKSCEDLCYPQIMELRVHTVILHFDWVQNMQNLRIVKGKNKGNCGKFENCLYIYDDNIISNKKKSTNDSLVTNNITCKLKSANNYVPRSP